MIEKGLRVRNGFVNGHAALDLARKKRAPEGLEREFEVAKEWYQAQLEKGRRHRARVKKASRPAAWTARLDKLCGSIVRARGVCEARGSVGLACSGPLQWCHGESRGHFRSRWNPATHLCMCAAHHTFFTHNPERWARFLMEKHPRVWHELGEVLEFEVPRGAARVEWMEGLYEQLKAQAGEEAV